MELHENIRFDNRYVLLRQLGRGGFSEVWLAHDNYMDLDVAIKIYAPEQGMDQTSIAEFRHEIKGVFNLNQSNLLRPQYLGVCDNMPYLVLSYCSAGSITREIGRMTEQQIWKLIHDVASGLTYLHNKDIVHQDIKPDNILVDNNGNYVITDFGISVIARRTLSKSVKYNTYNDSGTLAYMGPERFSKQPAPIKASDIWSFGAMIFEIITGYVPFGERGGALQKNGAEIPEISQPVSIELRTLVEQMLAMETWDRPTAEKLSKIAQLHIDEKKIIKNQYNTPKKQLLWLALPIGTLLMALGIILICNKRQEIDKSRVENTIREICKCSSKGGNYDGLIICFTDTVCPYGENEKSRLNSEIPTAIKDYVEQFPKYEISEPYNFKYINSSFPLIVGCDIDVNWISKNTVNEWRERVHKTYYITSKYKVSGYLDQELKPKKIIKNLENKIIHDR
jgi:serine/threonine protein kinase